jgi:hypothetical protein
MLMSKINLKNKNIYYFYIKNILKSNTLKQMIKPNKVVEN